jgi:hypothetical protein
LKVLLSGKEIISPVFLQAFLEEDLEEMTTKEKNFV